MRRAFAICLVAIMLTACAETPENILKKEHVTNNDSQSSTIFGGEPKLTDFAEMNASKSEYVDQIKELKLDNMTFSENLTADIPVEVKTGSYICPAGFEDNYVKIFTHYDEDFDEKYAVTDEKYYPTGPKYTSPDKDLILDIGCTGFFSYRKDEKQFDIYSVQAECIKTYPYNEAISCDDSYKQMLSGDYMTIAEAAEMAQSFAEDFTEAVDYPNKLTPSRISVYESGSEYFYYVDYAQSVNGVNIIGYNSQYLETDENTEYPFVYSYIYGGEVKNFTVNNSFDEYEITGALTETVDMKYAVEYLNETLAENMELELQRITFEYQMVFIDNNREEIENVPEDSDYPPRGSYALYNAEPCCVFYFDETPDKEIYAILHCDDMSVDFINNQR